MAARSAESARAARTAADRPDGGPVPSVEVDRRAGRRALLDSVDDPERRRARLGVGDRRFSGLDTVREVLDFEAVLVDRGERGTADTRRAEYAERHVFRSERID